MKFKPKKRDTYKIVGYSAEMDKYGAIKFPNIMGRIICTSCDMPWIGEYPPGKKLPDGYFGVAGLTDERQIEFWKIREEFNGKFCTVNYQNITSGKKVPRFGTYHEIVSINPEINPLI
jgi:hypothetical protein